LTKNQLKPFDKLSFKLIPAPNYKQKRPVNNNNNASLMPIAIETAGFWNQQAIDAIEDISRRISVST